MNGVSIIPWQDARDNPPTGDMTRSLMVEYYDRRVWLVTAAEAVKHTGTAWEDYPNQRVRRWAEIPRVIDNLTVGGMSAAMELAWQHADTDQIMDAVEGFRAAMPGLPEDDEG